MKYHRATIDNGIRDENLKIVLEAEEKTVGSTSKQRFLDNFFHIFPKSRGPLACQTQPCLIIGVGMSSNVSCVFCIYFYICLTPNDKQNTYCFYFVLLWKCCRLHLNGIRRHAYMQCWCTYKRLPSSKRAHFTAKNVLVPEETVGEPASRKIAALAKAFHARGAEMIQ